MFSRWSPGKGNQATCKLALVNQNSRTANSLRNISAGMIAQIVQMILGFVSRTVFVKYLAVEYLGVNSLFTNILSMLSLAELGLGAAFIYSLYKPMSEGNKTEIATIIRFYRKTYLFVGLFIFVTGCLLLPFLSDIIPQKPSVVKESIHLIYFIFLFNTAVSYLFSYKISLLDADQKISVATANSIVFSIAQAILQILILVLTSDFILYLVTQAVVQFASNWYISRVVDRMYPFLRENNHLKIDWTVKHKIISNVKATFFTKIGGVLVNGTDNLFINYFVGLAILGKYSNYVLLIGMVSSLMMIIFANIKSSVANIIVKESLEKQQEVFRALNFINFWLFGVCGIIFIFTAGDFIKLWIGEEYLMSFSVVLLLGLNFFMVGMQNAFWTFKSSFGFFQEGKYMILGTALINLVLSYFLGMQYGITGILLATTIARLVTNFWYDPYIVLKKGLQINPFHYLWRFGNYVFVLILAGAILYSIKMLTDLTPIYSFILNIVLGFIVTNVLIIIMFNNSSEMKFVKGMAERTVNMIRRKNL